MKAVTKKEEKKEPTIAERIAGLKQQAEQAKELYIKCQGAIEALEQLK